MLSSKRVHREVVHRRIAAQIPTVERAVAIEMKFEGKPQHRAAVQRAKRHEAKLLRSVEVLLSRPVRSFDELVALAQVARHLRADAVEPWRCLDDRVLAAIVGGVLSIAELPVDRHGRAKAARKGS